MVSLRHRILLSLAPLFVLLAVVGGYGAMLLYRIGDRIDRILRENYRSVIYMEELKENLERMDSAFQFAMAGRESDARKQFQDNWEQYGMHLAGERKNITLPGEATLVSRLSRLSENYFKQGNAFFASSEASRRQSAYFGQADQPGLLALFKETKDVANQIMRLNQDNMEQANQQARQTAKSSLIWFAACLSLVAVSALLFVRRTITTIVGPIESVTESVQAIGAGNLNQLVPPVTSDELGQLAGAVNSMARQLRDYRHSQQARLLRVQQATQSTIDSFPDPMLTVDQQGRVEMANPAARRVLGLVAIDAPEHSVTWNPPAALREPLAAALQKEQAYLPEGFDQAIPLATPNGPGIFLPRILPIKDPYGGTLGAAVVLADVTRFQLLDQVKSDLVATVSHELKTPLSSISMAIHVLLEEAVGPLTEKQTELLLEARASSERLLAMINNLLDLARLQKGAGHLEIRVERPSAILQSAADLIRQRAQDQGIELQVQAPINLPLISVDGRVLNHALKNLLDNALTYTDRGGRITLSAGATDHTIVISVADTGAGIPAQYVPHVFDRFFRVPGQSRGSGTGLGLAIVREIVAAHGGTVSCESEAGQGTTFRLMFPAGDRTTREMPALTDIRPAPAAF